MHYYTHNIGEFAAKTRFLTPEQIGIYVILKDEYYANGMRLACDRIAKLMPPQCESALQVILQRFFRKEDDFYVCDEFDEELSGYKNKSSVNSENAKKRWKNKGKENKPHANGCESDATLCESHANGCLTNNHKPITNNHNIYINDSSNHSSASEKNDPDFALDSKDKNPKIPFDEIVGLYNRMCVPGCVECLRLTPARKTALRSRAVELMKFWHAETQDEIIECFRRIFERVSESDFLMGRTQRSGDRSNFRVDLSWILKAENLTKILEEKYS